ncbi:Saccharopine dehydrogenase-like oxidoreductase [Collichthys lucidus]|uniref:Saccharopine dehydrogenase-like oxidoreductase n=1 Tax=Collichthys lucidus TaxID=240159 RepID=A0A4U5U7W0_COLLU|nr:Saccharopine dehydrogenase-like oxidoreductase [Collichthys lucidus]
MARVETTSNRPYHLVIFGASGFTGQFVVEEVARTVSEGPKGTLKWAVAGRSKQKLEHVLEQAAGVLSKPELRSEVDIIVADVGEPDTLAAMCKQAVIVLNCVGPYRFYGEPVVKACVENGAHHIDISGEPQGGCIHDGTWQSAVYGFADSVKLRSLRRKFNHKPLPTVGSRLKRRGALFYSNEIQQYALPFMGSDPSVVKRTQRFLVEEHEATPTQYGAYAGVGGIGNIIKLMFAGMMFWFLVKFSFGRNLLIKMEGSSFQFAFYGEGYKEGQDPSQGKPDSKINTMVQGPECGYVATPITMVQAALTILNEPTALPKKGGVYTPGAAFAKTTLIDRLNKHGVKFSCI